MTTKPRKPRKAKPTLSVVPDPAPSEPIPLEKPKRGFLGWVRWVIFGK